MNMLLCISETINTYQLSCITSLYKIKYIHLLLEMAKSILPLIILVCLVLCSFNRIGNSMEVKKQNLFKDSMNNNDTPECHDDDDCIPFCKDLGGLLSCGCTIGLKCRCCYPPPPPKPYVWCSLTDFYLSKIQIYISFDKFGWFWDLLLSIFVSIFLSVNSFLIGLLKIFICLD